ncbi:MAG: hypothetical protein A3H28_16370 [Acidobacteria bacterium RIFCSPLOWO2_02_FULL_61_28]|nr:MAG: hypothetical protein A3H28_16370 [Acidobacteria bacterium RIFCSPLOWO2_02_FULL_61_28]
MPFDWNKYFILGEELANRVNADEASKRTAISRAYYCVFNLAFARAETTAGSYPGGESYHNWCWSKYEKTRDRSCNQLGHSGVRMKRLRVKADYKAADDPRLDDEVLRMLEDARQFMIDLAALDPRYPLP